MNKKFISTMFILTSLFFMLFSCYQPKKPYFHPTYLPSAIPHQPVSRIFLSEDINKRIMQYESHNRGTGLLYKGEKIYWLSKDNLYLTLEGAYGTYLIIPSTQQITKIEGAEEEAVRKQIAERIDIHVTGAGQDALGRSGAGLNFRGRVADGERGVDIAGQWVRPYSNFEKTGIVASIKNRATGKTSSFNALFSAGSAMMSLQPREAEAQIRETFGNFYISPDSRYYIWREYWWYNIVLIDTENNSRLNIMDEYYFTEFSINPEWTKIALLCRGGREVPRYFIEIFNLSVR